MFRKRFSLAVSCLALVPMFLGGSAARADVTLGTASAIGIQANVDLSSTPGSATLLVPFVPYAAGSAPPAFNNSNSAASASASASVGNVVGSLSTGLLNVNAQSNATGTGAATTSAVATVNNLSVSIPIDALFLPPIVISLGATQVQSTAQVTGDFGGLTPSGTTTITNGTFIFAGVDFSAFVFAGSTPAPNTTITIDQSIFFPPNSFTGSISIVLNEQIVGGDGISNSRITVRAIVIRFNQFAATSISGLPAPITLQGDIIVSQSYAEQAAQAAGPGGGGGGGGGGGAQPVPEPSSLAMLGLVGVAGAIRRLRKWKSAVLG